MLLCLSVLSVTTHALLSSRPVHDDEGAAHYHKEKTHRHKQKGLKNKTQNEVLATLNLKNWKQILT